MPAIITDQFRILNAETFVNSFVGVGTTADNYFYTFLGHPDPENQTIDNYGWDTTNPAPAPKDSFEQETAYHDSMLCLKRITSQDIARIIPRYDWQAGSTYDMYRHDYDINNESPNTDAKSLYDAKYVVVTADYKVYLCINNGTNKENPNGRKSLVEPTFVSTLPQRASAVVDDGYIWKYLYTISVPDVIKFATTSYIPLPSNWGTGNTATVKDAAVNGKLEKGSIIVEERGTSFQLNTGTTLRVPVFGDGTGGEATITIGNGEITEAQITKGGKDYTRAFVVVGAGTSGLNTDDSSNVISCTAGSGAKLFIAVPPKGGHGADIYRELGSHRVMVYSKYDTNEDYITGNNFSRVGIIKNPTTYGTDEKINTSTASAVGALRLASPTGGSYAVNSVITQTVGVNSTAVGYVASWDKNSGVLRYYQPTGLSTSAAYSNKILPFTNSVTGGASLTIVNAVSNDLNIDTSFSGSSDMVNGKNESFGQTFTNGIAPPEIKKFSGEIIYVDNRTKITRSESQKEELKIVVEF